MSKRLVLSACAFVLLSASALAKPGVATTTVNLRAEANTTSDILAKMPAGARLDVGDCNDGWCAVTFQGKSGFAIQTALDASGRPRAVRRARRAASIRMTTSCRSRRAIGLIRRRRSCTGRGPITGRGRFGGRTGGRGGGSGGAGGGGRAARAFRAHHRHAP